ncbi:MAG: carboxylesterase family protein [Hyphomonadaceae bacterium]
MFSRPLLALATLAAAACTGMDAPPADPAMAATTTGTLRGAVASGVRSFKGVPYAQPPVGALRWAPPQAFSWSGSREATAFGAPCLQPTNPDGTTANGGGVAGASSEDCLYLNVWAPVNASNAPVMIFLYGGGGTMGAGSVSTYDGTAFARDGVVLITINYRHGALGGFAHPAIARANGSTDANFHLLDAIAALKWVKANAATFGGDASNILLFGESAGATMTANLVTSPLTKGLIQKAIIESTGSLPTPGTPLARANELGSAFATAHGLPGEAATADQLRAIPAAAIMANAATRGGLRTVIDGTTKPQSIMDSFASGSALDIPMIIGTNSDEGRLSGTQRIATYAMSGAPVFQYFFDYVASVRRADNPNGAPHAAELPFVFDTLKRDRRLTAGVTTEDQTVADLIHACWVAFAKQPTFKRTIDCPGFQWPARTEANGQMVAIFQTVPSLGNASGLRSPPNGAPPGPTSRDED